MKKILALALALCMMLAAAPFVLAADCNCGDPDCAETCACENCLGDCCDPVEEPSQTNDFFQMILDFFNEKVFVELKELFERIMESIFGPSLPF